MNWVFSEAIHYAENIGCRVLYLNPEKDAETWYKEKMKFVHIKRKNNQDIMFYDLHFYKNNNS